MSTPYHAVLSDFRPVQLSKPVPQRLTLEVMAYGFARAYCLANNIADNDGFRQVHSAVREKFDKYAVSPTHIKRRQLNFFPAVSDIRFVDGHFQLVAEPEHEYMRLYDVQQDPRGKDIKSRHYSYGKVVEQALAEMFRDTERAPDDLIHVTCSGYLAPNPVERMVAKREWFNTTVTNSYHMGCYGAFPAIKMAYGFLASAYAGVQPPKERVDIVHSELLSAHNNITDPRAENIIAMSLFADGLIRYSLYTEEALRREGRHGLRILALNEHLLPDSADDMTWVPGSHSFVMTLTPKVPVVIKRYVMPFVIDLVNRAGIDFVKERSSLAFAIHPGGPKIIEHIQDELQLSDGQVALSQKVFQDNGNMSSATVPHILKEVLEEVEVGTRVVCLAFGPGLTATGLVVEKI